MPWDKISKLFTNTGQPRETDAEPLAAPILLEGDESPWGVPVLDVRPVTLTFTSTSANPACAANAVSFGRDDGAGFIGIEPKLDRVVPIGLRFPIHGMLADGALFLPAVMEHKWAIYRHRGRMIFVRSWTRQVTAVAEVRTDADFAEITTLRGTFTGESEEPSISARSLEFLLRTHVLNLPYPTPLPEVTGLDAKTAAMAAFSFAGNMAHFATWHPVPVEPIPKAVRSISLLHFAVGRGEGATVRDLIQSGIPAGLLDRDGHAPLHWAVECRNGEIMGLLLDLGAGVDVRADDGTTPLMLAVQNRDLKGATLLLRRGADPGAADARGFTSLHRAAEMGELGIAGLLLRKGAFAHPEAGGHTPLSLARARGQARMVALLNRP